MSGSVIPARRFSQAEEARNAARLALAVEPPDSIASLVVSAAKSGNFAQISQAVQAFAKRSERKFDAKPQSQLDYDQINHLDYCLHLLGAPHHRLDLSMVENLLLAGHKLGSHAADLDALRRQAPQIHHLVMKRKLIKLRTKAVCAAGWKRSLTMLLVTHARLLLSAEAFRVVGEIARVVHAPFGSIIEVPGAFPRPSRVFRETVGASAAALGRLAQVPGDLDVDAALSDTLIKKGILPRDGGSGVFDIALRVRGMIAGDKVAEENIASAFSAAQDAARNIASIDVAALGWNRPGVDMCVITSGLNAAATVTLVASVLLNEIALVTSKLEGGKTPLAPSKGEILMVAELMRGVFATDPKAQPFSGSRVPDASFNNGRDAYERFKAYEAINGPLVARTRDEFRRSILW